MAAQILKCGKGRVWIDPDRISDVASAVTRSDVRRLITGGAIKKEPVKAVSRGRARHSDAQRAKGRQRGPGSRKGGSNARFPRKRRWIQLIRPIREELRGLRDDGTIDARTYREYYRRAKGGQFRSRDHVVTHLRMEGHLKKEAES
jgi:large subunit ribosomal protein L19e